MAVLEDVPGIEVVVLVRGQPLQEYEDSNDTDAQDRDHHASNCPVTCKYIESTDDTEFSVQTKVTNYGWGYRNHTLSVNTHVDGKWIRGILFRPQDALSYWPYPRTVEGQEKYDPKSGSWSMQRFKFAAVSTVDEAPKERVVRDMKIVKDLGVIEVKVYRVLEHGPMQRITGSSPQTGKFELTEKSMKGKAISHGTSYSSMPEFIQPPQFYDTQRLYEDNGPIAIYRFFYRSREALKHELIIPRSPSRSPTLRGLTDVERDRLAQERLEELRRTMIKKERKPIKREIGEAFDLTDDNHNTPRGPPRPTKKSRLASGLVVDVVDLTDD